MKNLHRIKTGIIGLVMVGAWASCSKSLLNEDLYSQIGSGTVSGAEGATLLTNGIYTNVQFLSYFGGNNFLLTTEAGTDEFFCNWGGTPPTDWGGQQNFLNMDAGHSMINDIWNNLYSMISQANVIVTQYGNATDSLIKQRVAEARFWRGYAYEKLYYVYGPVPLVTSSTQNLTNGIAKADATALLNFIETEMKAIETVLPPSYGSSDFGRPTSWAAKAFLARHYLNTKQWQNASDYALQVINNNQGLGLMDDYASVFSQDGNKEVILAVNHVAQSQKGNKYVALSMESGMRNALGISGVSASNGYGMAVPFFRTFAAGDKRVAPYDKTTGKGIAVSGILYDANGASVYVDANNNPTTVENGINRVVTLKWPVQMNIPNGEDASNDVALLRMGETYLTYAEAQNELNHPAVAAAILNPIRLRAGLGNYSTSITQVALRDSILQERGWELYHEGFRREDLLRAGKLLSSVSAKYQYYMGNTMPWGTNTDRLLDPIPTSALQLNTLLIQNKGY
jgi:hypothetical protein